MMSEIHFLRPDKLQLLWMVAALFFLGISVWALKRRLRSPKTSGSTYPFLGTMKFWFALMLTLALCVVAWARPFLEKGRVAIKQGNAEIVFVVDCSASMLLKDTGLARVDIAEREITKALASGIIKKGDRTAIFIFGKILSPRIFLTRDLDSFANEVGKIGRPKALIGNDLYWGSAIGSALRRTFEALDRQDMVVEFGKESESWRPKKRSDRLVIFLSDGDFFNYSNDGQAKLKSGLEKENLKWSLQEFRKRGLVIYSLGIGTRSGAPLVDILKDYKVDQEYDRSLETELKKQFSRLNSENLSYLASATGGLTFTLEHSSGDAGRFIKTVIDRHRSTYIEPIVQQERQELWLYVLLTAVAVFIIGTLFTKF